jgi:hypothetical protein
MGNSTCWERRRITVQVAAKGFWAAGCTSTAAKSPASQQAGGTAAGCCFSHIDGDCLYTVQPTAAVTAFMVLACMHAWVMLPAHESQPCVAAHVPCMPCRAHACSCCEVLVLVVVVVDCCGLEHWPSIQLPPANVNTHKLIRVCAPTWLCLSSSMLCAPCTHSLVLLLHVILQPAALRLRNKQPRERLVCFTQRLCCGWSVLAISWHWQRCCCAKCVIAAGNHECVCGAAVFLGCLLPGLGGCHKGIYYCLSWPGVSWVSTGAFWLGVRWDSALCVLCCRRLAARRCATCQPACSQCAGLRCTCDCSSLPVRRQA